MKKTLPGLERGEESGDVGLALQGGAGGLDHRYPHLGGDDVRERGLAEAGRPREQDVVERLPAPARGLEEDSELLGDLDLVDEVLSAEGRSERSKSSSPPAARASWIDDLLAFGKPRSPDPLSRFDGHPVFAAAALRSAAWTSSSGVSPSPPSSSRSASWGV